jgi:hypothetical protein
MALCHSAWRKACGLNALRLTGLDKEAGWIPNMIDF